jgi:hypothetical protein
MTTLMRNGRDRRSGKPVKCHARKERALLVGTRSANHIRAGSHSGCTQRPDTWLHPNASRKRQMLPLHAGAVRTWHLATGWHLYIGPSLSAVKRAFASDCCGQSCGFSPVRDGLIVAKATTACGFRTVRVGNQFHPIPLTKQAAVRERNERKSRNATVQKVGTLMTTRTKSLKNGGSDGARTRDLRRDRPAVSLTISTVVPTFRAPQAGNRASVGTLQNNGYRRSCVVRWKPVEPALAYWNQRPLESTSGAAREKTSTHEAQRLSH